jgi:hypothetical protein
MAAIKDSSVAFSKHLHETTNGLTAIQIVSIAAWATLLWFAAALFIRWIPIAYFGRGALTILLFIAAIPVGWATVWATRRAARLKREQLLGGVALGCAIAVLLDGIALTWTQLYGHAGDDLVPAAAWLLWGIGAILTAAVVMVQNRDPETRS